VPNRRLHVTTTAAIGAHDDAGAGPAMMNTAITSVKA
jgi:hypothetical protein